MKQIVFLKYVLLRNKESIRFVVALQRFLPSEFGTDVDRTSAVEPAKSAFAGKVQIRRAIEAEGIPYTYIVNNCFAGYYLPTLVQFEPGLTSPPRDKVTILGDGNAKGLKIL